MVCVDLSAITGAGDVLMAAAMLATWSYGHAMIEASHALTRLELAPPRRFLAVLDEMWRALRGSSALVEQADALTRVYRHKSVAHLMLTHSLDDLAAVGTDADRAKARGFLDRCAITVLTAMSERELDEIGRLRHLTRKHRSTRAHNIVPAHDRRETAQTVPQPTAAPSRPTAAGKPSHDPVFTPVRRPRRGYLGLTGRERALVQSWSSGSSWSTGGCHPGRGKYLLKAGDRVGIPVEMTLVGDEPSLYDTDPGALT